MSQSGAGGAAAARRELADTVAKIGQLSPDHYGSGTTVFNALKTGVNRAVSGREGSLEDFLDDLEPKAKVLAFLVALHQQRRIYRKQIATVLQVLVQAESWMNALKGDADLYKSLPSELLVVVDGEVETPDAADAAGQEAPASAAAAGEPRARSPPAPTPAAEPTLASAPPAPSTPAAPELATAPGPEAAVATPASTPAPASASVLAQASASAFAPAPRVSAAAASDTARHGASSSSTARPPASSSSAGGGASEVVRKELEESMMKVASLQPGFPEEAGASAFDLLKRAVTHACNGQDRDPNELLGDLEPKGPAVSFLLEFYERKKLQRRNVGTVFAGLLQADAWLDALQADGELSARLPEDLRAVFERESSRERAPPPPQGAEATPALESAPTEASVRQSDTSEGVGAQPFQQGLCVGEEAKETVTEDNGRSEEMMPTDAEVQEAINRAKATLLVEPPPLTASFIMRATDAESLLEESLAKIQTLRRCPNTGELLDVDAASDAFESLRRALTKATATRADQEALARLEGKKEVFDFLIEFGQQRRKYHSRVVQVTNTLLECPAWSAFLCKRRGMHEAIQELQNGDGVTHKASSPPATPASASSAAPPRDRVRKSILHRASSLLCSPVETAPAEVGLENGLVCCNGHSIDKKKEGLRWHQRMEFWNQRRCDLCDEEIPQTAVRWRCHQKCDFDVCNACYNEGNEGRRSSQGDSSAPSSSRRASGELRHEPLGIERVRIPEKAVHAQHGVTFFGIEVTPSDGGPAYPVPRRYNDFLALANRLDPQAMLFPNHPFPQKTLLGMKCTENALEERRAGLANWLQAVVDHPLSSGVWRTPLRTFLHYGERPAKGGSCPQLEEFLTG